MFGGVLGGVVGIALSTGLDRSLQDEENFRGYNRVIRHEM